MIRQTVIMLSCAALSACATLTPTPETFARQALKTGNYQMDPDHAALLFRISHFGISSYTGRFDTFSATLDFDETTPEAARLSATVQIDSLDVNPKSFAKTLTGSAWLDADAHPEAKFSLTGVKVTGDNTGTAIGDLTLKGITKPINLDVTFTGGAKNPLSRKYTVGFAANGSFKRSDFGIDKYLSIAGDKFDFDTITLEFNGEFAKSE